MNYMKYLMAFALGFFMCFNALAQTSAAPTTLADVKTGVIANLQKDGYLSEKMAREAAQKYITAQDAQTSVNFTTSGNNNTSSTAAAKEAQSTSTVNWAQYLSWMNAVKVIGIVLLFVAFSGFLKRLAKSMWHIITLVPAIVYQGVFLILSLVGTIWPEKIWASEAFYIALFCSFANLVILGWICSTYKGVQDFLKKLFNFGIPPGIILSFWGMIYFGALAIGYQSSIFGFFAAVGLSGIFSFCIMYFPGVVYMSFKESTLAPLVFGHILILVVYAFVYNQGWGMPYLSYFNAGIQYYCTIALGVGLLVGSSPFYKKEVALSYSVIFFLVAMAGLFAYFFLGLPTIGSIILVCFALLFLEWIGYMSFKTSWLVGCAVMGGVFYGAALLMEKYGAVIMNSLKAALV